MTEYDYSPEAVERYQQKMEGVGRWAYDQKYYAPKYRNPFTDQPPSSSSTSPARAPARQQTYPQARPNDRPQPTRSRTLPANAPHTSRAYAIAQQGDTQSPQRSSSRTHHRSGSQPPEARYPYPTPGAHQLASRASPMAYVPPPPPPPVGGRQVVQSYTYVPGQPIYLPPPRDGERYVVYPPPGGRVQVVDPRHHTRTVSHSQSGGSRSRSGSKSSSPTKRGGDPLFKRLINNLTPNIEWGSDNSRSGRSLRRDGSSRRRSTSR